MGGQIIKDLTINSTFSQLRNEVKVANRAHVAEQGLKPRFSVRAA